MAKLMKFYGKECPHCIQMEKLDEKLEKEEGVKIEKLEVWYNHDNAEKMQKLDTTCGGVPFYKNEDTGKTLCGSVNYETLKNWAEGKEINQPEHSHEHDEHDEKHHHHH